MGAAPALALVLLVGQSAAVEPRALRHGRELFDQLRFDEAATALRGVLRTHPAPAIAAKARLFLGLIDLNLADEVRGREELRRALELDPACALPAGLSPKIQEIFESIRKEVAPPPAAATQAPPTVMVPGPIPPPSSEAATTPALPSAEAQAEATPSHWPAYAVGGGAVALLGVGIVLGVMSNNTLSQGTAAGDAGTAYSLQQSANSQALWADICFGASALAAAGGVWLFFSERSAPTVTAAAIPLPGGGAVALAGSF
jgi:hypothetical protein